MNPLISIVVPVYNTENFIAETIDSVIKQRYENWELILVDDGSSDGSAQIIKNYTEQDNRIFYHWKKNGGQASARNFGIKKSKGSLIGFMDADDLWLENKLSAQIDDLQKYDPDFLYGLGYFYYPERKEQLKAYDWIYGERTGVQFFKELYHSCAVNINTVIVKKELFDTVGYFDEDQTLRGTEDLDFWLRIAKNVDKVYGSPNRNVYYRIHEGGIHLQRPKMLIGRLKILAKYDQEPLVGRMRRKREYRYLYRELLNELFAENRREEIKPTFKSFFKHDSAGLGTLTQALFIRILPLPAFLKFSNGFIYRIAYRLERLSYSVFLK